MCGVSEHTCLRIELLRVGGVHEDPCVHFLHACAHIYGCARDMRSYTRRISEVHRGVEDKLGGGGHL